jgi:hypothetical protein
MCLSHMQTQLKGRLMGGQVRGSWPRHHAGEHKAFVWVCEALHESLLTGLSDRTSFSKPHSPVVKRPLCLCWLQSSQKSEWGRHARERVQKKKSG